MIEKKYYDLIDYYGQMSGYNEDNDICDTFYNTDNQVNDYINTDIEQRIKNKYADYAKNFMIRLEEEDESGELVEVIKPLQVDTIFLRYK